MVGGRLGVFSKAEKNTPNMVKFIKIFATTLAYSMLIFYDILDG